ncbi:MAG: hypothetical protein Q9186_007664 [Xanthomendoza sp. 1 TL-2023]
MGQYRKCNGRYIKASKCPSSASTSSGSKGSKDDKVGGAVTQASSGASSFFHEMSRLLMIVVVMPMLWYLLEEGRVWEVVEWGVMKVVNVLERKEWVDGGKEGKGCEGEGVEREKAVGGE